MRTFDRDSRRYRLIAEGTTTNPLSRRTFLEAALATGILTTLPASRSFASETKKRLVAGTRTLEVNGRAARVYSLIGPGEHPGIRLRAGERFRVDLANHSGQQTLVHWHGQLPPWTQDPWPETPALADGAVQSYENALREERQEIVLMLHDFTFRSHEEVLARLTNTDIGSMRSRHSG